jgi:hypothetical protein
VGAAGDRLSALDSISDPAEVSELLGLTESSQGASASSAFRSVLKQADDEFSRAGADEMEIDGPAALVSLSGQGYDDREQAGGASEADGEGAGQDVGRIRSELEHLRRRVRQAMGRQD